jgi:hypothetical protein
MVSRGVRKGSGHWEKLFFAGASRHYKSDIVVKALVFHLSGAKGMA